MILINLLPRELRVKETKKINVPYRPIIAGVFGIFLILSLYNLVVYIRVREEHRNLEKQWNTMSEKNVQAEALERELGSSILTEIDFYNTFVAPPLETAKVLNLVTDLIPNSIWLTDLKFDRFKKDVQVVLSGFCESGGKSSKLIEIQNFVNALKDQMEHFSNVAVPAQQQGKVRLNATVTMSSQKSEVEKVEVTQFNAVIKPEVNNAK